jgi:hypothetical protein
LSDPPLRAPFTRVTGVDPVKVILDAAVGVPIPLPPRRSSRLTLEVDASEGRLLDADDRVLSAWARGAVDARVRELNDRFVELQLRGPGADYRVRGAATEAAVAIAERLAHDTRIAHGTDAEADAALRALAEATLPPAVRTEYHAALHARWSSRRGAPPSWPRCSPPTCPSRPRSMRWSPPSPTTVWSGSCGRSSSWSASCGRTARPASCSRSGTSARSPARWC